ncbi:hypothetical protein D3C80_1099410 [compost metagenome]
MSLRRLDGTPLLDQAQHAKDDRRVDCSDGQPANVGQHVTLERSPDLVGMGWRPNSVGKIEPLLCYNFKRRLRVRALDRLFKLFLCGRVFARFEELARLVSGATRLEQTHLRIITDDERLFLAEKLVAVPENLATCLRNIDV